MFKQKISWEIWGGTNGKYRLKDSDGNHIDQTPEDTCRRVAKALADVEEGGDKRVFWEEKFYKILSEGRMSGGGRITANAGSEDYKKNASSINCVLMRQIPDSMAGIMQTAKESALTLRAGCGVGYDFSSIRPKGFHVFGAGSETSGVLSFMKIFDATCSTVMSGGSRRGAQLGALDVQHPEIESFISCKREDGVLRNFNLSVLITDDFMNAVKNNDNWNLWFWKKTKLEPEEHLIKLISKDDIPYHHPEYEFFRYSEDHAEVVFENCTTDTLYQKNITKSLPAKDLFDQMMTSTYDFAEPGFILVDRLNKENTLYFHEIQRASNPCGEQNLPPHGSCLLGSMILAPYVSKAFEKDWLFDWDLLKEDVRSASRLLDNVVDISNLPLAELTAQLDLKRRHGLGFTGLGTIFNMMCMRYGSNESLAFANDLMHTIARVSLEENISLAEEKGCAPIFDKQEHRELVIKSQYLSRLLNSLSNKAELVERILASGLRYSHATSIAPTGTMSLTWGNNCSNGLEPSFSNSYMRNIRQPGKKTKVQEEVMSLEFLLWKEKFGDAELPEWWSVTDDLSVDDHINIQAVIQKWTDAACSKTINIPTDYPFEDFKQAYFKGWEAGLKGVTTFRFNPEVFTGVLVRKEDLENTKYVFITEDNEEIVVKGSDEIEYDGEMHNAANLFDALKEGLYGDM